MAVELGVEPLGCLGHSPVWGLQAQQEASMGTHLCTMPREWRYVIPDAMSIRLSRIVPCNASSASRHYKICASVHACLCWSFSSCGDALHPFRWHPMQAVEGHVLAFHSLKQHQRSCQQRRRPYHCALESAVVLDCLIQWTSITVLHIHHIVLQQTVFPVVLHCSPRHMASC